MQCPVCGTVSTNMVYKCRKEDCFFAIKKTVAQTDAPTKTHSLTGPTRLTLNKGEK